MAQPYSGADFLHGPVAMISDGFPCFLYAPEGKTYPHMVELAEKLATRHAEVISIAHSSEIQTFSTRTVKMPSEIDERLSPLVYIVAGQLWACHMALTRGNNPDNPRGLSKVTLTR